MTSKREISIEDQFRNKPAARQAAAAAPFEEKFLKLLHLQKINYELAMQAGRPCKRPWKIDGFDSSK